jgi:hypothetical protein
MHLIKQTQIFDGSDVDARLRMLGLDRHSLLNVVRIGENARAEATPHDPLNAGALDAYRYRVRAFRDRYVPDGWIVDHEGGVEKTWAPSKQHVVITRAGDDGVGVRTAIPQPKSKPGNEVRSIVESAQLLLSPDWDLSTRPDIDDPAADYATWILLVSRRADTVRSELSSPIGLSDDDSVLGWHERILLPEIDLGSPDHVQYPAPIDVDVPVVRKR